MIFFALFCIYNITQILSESYFFKPFRDLFKQRISFLYELTTCFLCTSVWISFGFQYLFPEFNLHGNWFLNTMFFSCCVWFIHVIENKLT